MKRQINRGKLCKVLGCDKPARNCGFCHSCYDMIHYKQELDNNRAVRLKNLVLNKEK